jgi:hypothetical protein
MGWLITAGIIALIFGLLLLSSRDFLANLGAVFNQSLGRINGFLSPIRIVAGIVLVIIGGWLISVAFNYPGLWYLHLIGILALIFGLLYLFAPQWLELLSGVCNQILLSTDELVIGARIIVGIIFILAAIYMLFSAFLIR